MKQKALSLIILLLSSAGFFLHGVIGLAEGAEAESALNGLVWENDLLVGILVLVTLGLLAGAYALLFNRTGSLVKRMILFNPLLKVVGKGGDRKSLTTGENRSPPAAETRKRWPM